MKKIFKLTAVFAALVSIASADEAADAEKFLRANVVETKLSNGATVLLLNRGYSPTLALNIYFNVGSVDEDYDTAGAAHLLEHMLFKGTDKIGTKNYAEEKKILGEIEAVGETIDRLKVLNPSNEKLPALQARLKELEKKHSEYVITSPYDALYTSAGGVGFNASTSKDTTGYYIELPSGKLELWAQLESERLRNPVLREFYLERSNVIEERMMRYESSGTGALFERFLGAAFLTHPYRHPVIGWNSSIPNLSIKRVRQFYRERYIPSRMVIVVVGKQNPYETFTVIEKYFSSLPQMPEPKTTSAREPEQMGERRVIYRFEANPYVILGWHKPAYPSREDYIFDVISEIMSGGRASVLDRNLIVKKGIAQSVDSWNGAPGARYDNMFVLFGAPKNPHTADELEKAMLEEIEALKKGVDPADLARAKNRIESDMVFRLSDNSGLAQLLGTHHSMYGSWTYIAAYVTQVKSVTPEEIKAAAEKYLTRDNMTSAQLLKPLKGNKK